MANKTYIPKAITTSIKFTSRASIKIRDNYFTFEACEERMIPDIEGIDIEQEKLALWKAVNTEVDDQIEDTVKAQFSPSKKKNNG